MKKKFKTFILLSLLVYFLGLIGLGLVITNSAKRVSDSLGLTLQKQEKKLEKFKETLQIYKPYIKEIKKVLDEKNSDTNH